MVRKWKTFENVCCPNCGDDVLVLSAVLESINEVFDDEKCKCADSCGWEGHTVVDEDNAWVSDGNLDSLPN